MLLMLPVLFDAKTTLEDAIQLLQPAIRVQKHWQYNRQSGKPQYQFLASNFISLDWMSAIDSIAEVDTKPGMHPLTADQLRHFPMIKDQCHHAELECIPGYVLQKEYDISNKQKLKEVAKQLMKFFSVLCVESAQAYILIDFTEMVFRPNIVHSLLTFDSPNSDDDEDVTRTTSESKDDKLSGIMFYSKPSPIPLQDRYPQLLTTMLEFVKLHAFAAQIRRRAGTSTSVGVTLSQIHQHVLDNVDGLTKISRSKVYNLLPPA